MCGVTLLLMCTFSMSWRRVRVSHRRALHPTRMGLQRWQWLWRLVWWTKLQCVSLLFI